MHSSFPFVYLFILLNFHFSYDIGLIGRKHLNEISGGGKVAMAPTPKPTQKPIRTAPVTHVSDNEPGTFFSSYYIRTFNH